MHSGIPITLFFPFLFADGLYARLHHKRVNIAITNPLDDPFYTAPSNLDSYKLGDIIRSREVTTLISANKSKSSHQILYRTTDTLNNSQATVATIWSPLEPKVPQQIFSYNSYMDSVIRDCSVSWAWVKESSSQGKDVVTSEATTFVEWALTNGIYAVSPDSEGPKAAFIAGFQNGQASLDGIRATRNFYKLSNDTGIAMFGYSGGASTTAWAANLAERYAPDLNILGVVHGGTPIDLRSMITFLNGGLFSGSAGAGLVGLMQAYPAFNAYLSDHADDYLVKVIKEYRSRGECLHQAMYNHTFINFFNHINVTDFMNQPIPKAILARESLLMDISTVGVSSPKFPRMIWHSSVDEIAPFADEQKFITQQCSKGANIQFQVLYMTEHSSGGSEGTAAAVQFLGQLYNGTTPTVQCGLPAAKFPLINSMAAKTILGGDVVASIIKTNGTKVLGETIKLLP